MVVWIGGGIWNSGACRDMGHRPTSKPVRLGDIQPDQSTWDKDLTPTNLFQGMILWMDEILHHFEAMENH